MDPTLVLPLDAFVRSIGVSSESPHAFFLGAGASVSSGVPHAGQCTWEWKRHIFLTKNPGLEEQFSELSLSSTQDRIQHWLEEHGYPAAGDPNEYGFYIEECYPIPEHRRRYFQRAIRDTRPSVGYRLLTRLALAGMAKSVWTTNFDELVSKAAAETSLVAVEVGLDSAQRTVRLPSDGELLCVALHGDYRYDRLKNTPDELQRQDESLRESMIERLQSTNLIVAGYSGRDASIMDALKSAYGKPGPGEIYWCGRGDSEPLPAVAELLALARTHGRTAYYIPTQGFDDLLIRLASHCLTGSDFAVARGIVTATAQSTGPTRAPFTVERLPLSGVIKSNAYPIALPSDVLTFTATGPEKGMWKWVRERTHGHPVVAVPLRGKIVALGTEDGVRDAFGSTIQGPIERSPVDHREMAITDGALVSLFRTALVRMFGEISGLGTDGKRLLWEQAPSEKRQSGGIFYSFHQAASIAIRSIGGKTFLVIKPTLRIVDQAGVEAPREIAQVLKNAALGYQHNDKYYAAVKSWQEHIFGKGQSLTLAYPPNCGSTFRFILTGVPAFARIGDLRRGRGIAIDPKIEKWLTHSGFELTEPRLLFAPTTAGAKPVGDEHPMRGIVQNRPFDFALTSTALADRVKVGVVCPKPEAHRCHSFLAEIVRPHPEPKGGQEYIIDFPGFQSAFRVPLHLPAQPLAPGWATAPEPPGDKEDYPAAVQLAQEIVAQIDTLQASHSPNVVVIFIPTRWARYRQVKTGESSFDLHDYLKAQCVRRGVATQLIEENTLADPQMCRVYWWLSLALYAKSKRTPWALDCLEEGTAYAGVGLSIDTNQKTGQHVVLGCSHIYSSRGEGLRYRLTKIENPIIRQGNPYLSEDDARRLGESIRQLYFDATLKLPERVVIHKRTPFQREEREGLFQGLAGVRRIDLVEVTIEPELRDMASVFDGKGAFRQDTFPVRRGTVICLDDFSALLWNHGVTRAVQSGRKYYQGKRRIPTPLVLRRHSGDTSLEVLAREILGLSKMNWNSFDLYAKVPATIASSNEIARIGSMLDRFSDNSYDYRLFM